MDTDAPPLEVTFPAGADSPLRHSSLISAAAFADVVALTTSPAAAAASASTIILEVSQSFLLSHHRIHSMNSYFCQLYEFIPYREHMNSYHCQFYEFIHPLYNMNSYPTSTI